jgi:hypothetical protein
MIRLTVVTSSATFTLLSATVPRIGEVIFLPADGLPYLVDMVSWEETVVDAPGVIGGTRCLMPRLNVSAV